MNRRGFLSSLLTAACASVVRFYPAPKAIEAKDWMPAKPATIAVTDISFDGIECVPGRRFVCPTCKGSVSLGGNGVITRITHFCRKHGGNGQTLIQGYLIRPADGWGYVSPVAFADTIATIGPQ